LLDERYLLSGFEDAHFIKLSNINEGRLW